MTPSPTVPTRALRADLVVVGAGPAGLAATATALAGGLRVVLLDAGSGPGGQFWRHPPQTARDGIPTGDLHHDLATFAALTAALDAGTRSGQLRVGFQHDVWTVARDDDGFVAHAVDRRDPAHEAAVTARAPRLLLATGAYDRQLPFPGWDLPGVLTVGGLQALLKGGGVVAGQRVALGGTGPFLLPVAAALARRGADVVIVAEAASPLAWARQLPAVVRNAGKVAEGVEYAAALARHRVPVRSRTAIVAAHGDAQVEAVDVAPMDRHGRPDLSRARRLSVDIVGTGWGFVPQLDHFLTLGADLRASEDGNSVVRTDAEQRTSVPGLYAAGEPCGVGGAALALREGQLAGEAVLADVGRPSATSPRRLAQVRAIVARLDAFAVALRLAHPLPAGWLGWLRDDTVICRCEEVPFAAVRAAADEAVAAPDHRQIKQLTRAGMGWCQGRMCGPAVHGILGGDRVGQGGVAPTPYCQSERLVAVPVPLGTVAILDAE